MPNDVDSSRAQVHAPSYRADIDGLRAIAVLSVVLYHMAHSVLPGGYLGVDMFFVISGYLITQIIRADIVAGRFSIAGFYDRRIRRIVPALLVLLVVSTIAAVLLLLPADLLGYGKALLATLGFVANIYAWRDTNYFTRVADEKPLLHMWSLGVEEQFYILFPLILAFLARRWSRGTLPVVVAIAAGSLAINVLALKVGGSAPAFYMLPSRAWELGVGAVLALLPGRELPAPARGTVLTALGAAFGLGLVAFSLASPWEPPPLMPSALLIVAGTALLVRTGRHVSMSAFGALSVRPLVFIGLISYSLYLWHWPVIVFSKYYLVRELTMLEQVAAALVMIVAAIISWRFVERPFRGKRVSSRTVWAGAGIGAAVLALAGAGLIFSHGLPSRLDAEAARINQAVGTHYHCPVSEYLVFGAAYSCGMNLPTRSPADADVILLGNSHAQMYEPLWESIVEARGQTGLMVSIVSCLPTVTVNIDDACIRKARINLDAIATLPRAGTVIIGMNWWHEADALVDATGKRVDNTGNAGFIRALDDLIQRLEAMGKRVVLIGPIVDPGWDVASVLSRQLAFGWPVTHQLSSPTADFHRRFGNVLAHFGSKPGIGFARPDLVMCDERECHFLVEGDSLFSDNNHIASTALSHFRPEFERAFAR